MTKPYRRVCLDMDGVLCDFYGACAALLGKDAEYAAYLAAAEPPESNNYEVFGSNPESVKNAIDEAGEDFWVDMPAYEWVPELVTKAIRASEGVTFLTSPGRFKHAHVGKIRWLKKHGILTSHTDVSIAHRKYLHAGPRDLLIDDHPGYLERWSEAGGAPLLVARAWNGRRGHTETEILEKLSGLQ